MLDMTAVPNDRAGFIDAPDTGMPRMDNVICINPIANGAISRMYPRVSRAKYKKSQRIKKRFKIGVSFIFLIRNQIELNVVVLSPKLEKKIFLR